MIGYCNQCGCAVYTVADVGFKKVSFQLVSKGVIPRVKYYYAPIHELICSACFEEEKAIPFDVMEAAFQAWAEQEKTRNVNWMPHSPALESDAVRYCKCEFGKDYWDDVYCGVCGGKIRTPA